MEYTIDSKLQAMANNGITSANFDRSKLSGEFEDQIVSWLADAFDIRDNLADTSIITKNWETFATTYTIYGMKLTFK